MSTKTQTAVVQRKVGEQKTRLPLQVLSSRPIPAIEGPYDVLVRISAAGLNPTDYKMVMNFYMEDQPLGCDFCGVVEEAGDKATALVGTRVIGADFPYRPNNLQNGAFAQYAVCDSRQTLQVPATWDDTQAAGLGAIGWGTACLALSDPEALNLKGRPSCPASAAMPVIVYGGASATGLVAIQMLRSSGYHPIAVCSDKSAPLVMACGAVGTAAYTSPDCVERVRSAARGVPIKHALDCITTPESVATCFAALARIGGRYACLEECPEAWRTRASVQVKVVMGFESKGVDVDLGNAVYTRHANPALFALANSWTSEMQSLLDGGGLRTIALKEVSGGLHGVRDALEALRGGEARGYKLVARVSHPDVI